MAASFRTWDTQAGSSPRSQGENSCRKGFRETPRSSARPMAPAVTVVVCTYRRQSYLRACIRSLMEQDFPGLQILVVGVSDDAGTLNVVDEFGVKLVVQSSPQGVSAARNLGIGAARTEIVAFIDDDARARPSWARSLVQAFDKPGVGATGGPVLDTRLGEQVVFRWAVDPFGVTHRRDEGLEGLLTPTLNGCNMAFSKEALAIVGGFDPYYRYYFDETDLCVRLARAGFEVRYVDEAIVDHDFAEGPTRERFLYFSSRMRAYFSMKNFGGRVSSGDLLLGQVGTLREDLRSYRRLRFKYSGLSGFWRAVHELGVGRLEGIIDGSLACHAQGTSPMISRELGAS